MTNLVLVGNANSGKTTIFNFLAKTKQKTGNWLGVTTRNFSKGICLKDKEYLLTDLAGIYSLDAKTDDEKDAVKYLNNNKDKIILNVLDCFNLRRSLLLTLSLKQAGFKVICVLNFYKKFIKKKCKLEIEKLSKNLGLDLIIFERNERLKEKLSICVDKAKTADKSNVVGFNAKGFKQVDFILFNCYTNTLNYGYHKIDKILLNKWLAFPVFCLVMMAVFFISFGFVGQWLSGCFEKLAGKGINLLWEGVLFFKPHPIISDIYFNVVGVSIISVFKFCSQVMLVLLCLHVLEQSGYITRVAFVLDDYLEKLGLAGKGIFTLLLGLGCATSAISSSRVIANYKARQKTAMLTSIMPCMAKLPLTLAIISALFSEYVVLTMLIVYLVSLSLIVILALILNKGVLKTEIEDNSVLEFPSLKLPNLKHLIFDVYSGVKNFVGRILIFSVAVSLAIYLLSNLKIGGVSAFSGISEFIGFFSSPLGLNIGIISSALILGFLAKELIASSVLPFLASLLASGLISPPVAISLLIFSLYYTPCYSTFYALQAEFNKETANLAIVTQFLMSYVLSFITYNIMLLCADDFVFNGFNLIIALSVVIVLSILIKINIKGLNKPKYKILN